MRIQRTNKRIVAQGAHPYFQEHRDLWKLLKNGEVIEIPDLEFETISNVFQDTIQQVLDFPELYAEPLKSDGEEGL